MTLKEVAELAGVSTAAVSLYINGKTDGRVSPATQHRIEQAIQESGYVLSQRTRKRRDGVQEPDTKNIALFWSVHFKKAILGEMLLGLQQAALDLDLDNCNFEICPYRLDELYKHKRVLCSRQYHGIILASITESDMQFLESISPTVPIVLINRRSKKYHSVYIESTDVGNHAAELIDQKGYRSICTVSAQGRFLAANKRFLGFLDACRSRGMSLPDEFRLITEDSIDGGIRAAQEYLSYSERPSLIFTTSDEMAYGVLWELKRSGIKVPGDVGLFSFGFERPDLTAYTDPPISVIDVSSGQLAYESARLLITILRQNTTSPQVIELPARTVLRESF